ncbi:MAG: Na+/H+ antiporter subunit E [Parvibaculaceae bacterium]|nr:Na+/H+ antiporter subunit E [Parvibaculaceae bacterium]
MARPLIFLLVLASLWLALSGLFMTMPLILGLFSCLACLLVSYRMGLLDDRDTQIPNMIRIPAYSGWIALEVIKANIAIAKVILSRRPQIAQQFIRVPSSQKSGFGKALFANSITLTPGTVTVETANGVFLVHALTHDAASPEAFAAMDRLVTATETGQT